MQTLTKEQISVGLRVVFVDHALNLDASYVAALADDLNLGGRGGIVVHVDPLNDHATSCASKAKALIVTGKEWEVTWAGEGDDRKEVSRKEVPFTKSEHAACDCGFSAGKRIAVYLKEPIENGHTCDGFTPAGHGAWARPEHLYTEAAHAEHVAAHAEARLANAEIDAAKAKAADVIAAYTA